MALSINVQGHRNVYRQVKQVIRHDWTCPACGARNRYYWVTCPVPGCNHPRP